MRNVALLAIGLVSLFVMGCDPPKEGATPSGESMASTESTTENSPSTSGTTEEVKEETPAPEPVTDVSDRKPKDGEEVAVLDTSEGKIVIMFFPDVAPNHVKRFKECVTKGIYTGTRFHRVIPGFMIQGGDPNSKDNNRGNDGMGGYGSMLNSEFSAIKHVRGILSAARTNDPNSAQSQFFLMHDAYPPLDGQYSVYGKIVSGLEVVDKIVNLPRDTKNNPEGMDSAKIKSAKIEKWPLK